MQIFFVLSGFLITNLLLTEQQKTGTVCLANFYLRRAFRIFPAALFFLAIVIVIYWKDMHWYHILAVLAYVANLDISRPWIFGHLWSLSIEEQFYLLWPFALKLWPAKKTPILIVAFLFTPFFHVAVFALHLGKAAYGGLPGQADSLAIGCLLAICAPKLPRIAPWLAALCAIAPFAFTFFSGVTVPRTLFLLFVLQPMIDVSIAAVIWHVINRPYAFLNWGPVIWLGQISYSLYLWQQPFCANRAPLPHFGYSLILPSVGCACFSYYLVEQPMLRLRGQLRWPVINNEMS